MSESGPCWTKVATPFVTAQVGQFAQSGVSTYWVSSRSIVRTQGPRFFTGAGGDAVAAVGRCKFPFAVAFTSERDDIHHLSGFTKTSTRG